LNVDKIECLQKISRFKAMPYEFRDTHFLKDIEILFRAANWQVIKHKLVKQILFHFQELDFIKLVL
jgi:hypothetical protein